MGMSSRGSWEAESLRTLLSLPDSRVQLLLSSSWLLPLGNADTRLPAAPTSLIFQWSRRSAYLSKMSWSLNVSYYLTYLQSSPRRPIQHTCRLWLSQATWSQVLQQTPRLPWFPSPPRYSESISLSFSMFRLSFSANHFLWKSPPPFSPETFFFLPHVLQTTQDALWWDHAINDCLQSKRKWEDEKASVHKQECLHSGSPCQEIELEMILFQLDFN